MTTPTSGPVMPGGDSSPVDTNILAMHTRILDMYTRETESLGDAKARLDHVRRILTTAPLRARALTALERTRDELAAHVHRVETGETRCFYVMETAPLLAEYQSLLDVPIKMNFMGPRVDTATLESERRKRGLVRRYLDIAARYTDVSMVPRDLERSVRCTNGCRGAQFEVVDETTYICTRCYSTQTIMRHTTSYSDVNRVNVGNTYTYERKVHFAECIDQYQGRQNCTIPPNVYAELEDQFDKHRLLHGTPDTDKRTRYADITKNHILMFLKDLKYPNHYENVHLIHATMTGRKADDISHLEDQLLNDFDTLSNLYDARYKNIVKRKNFINTQYVLYQLLRHHKHPCVKEEFIVLKTIIRKDFHDNTCRALFEELGWNHTPFF